MELSAIEFLALGAASKLIGTDLTPLRRATGGYTPALRVVCDSNKGRFFVKVGTTPLTAEFIAREISIYQRMDFPFMPRVIAADHNPELPILVIEDLSDAEWPPPWSADCVDRVVGAIKEMHAQTAPIEGFFDVLGLGESNWETVAADPSPFLNLGIVDSRWLDRSLPLLMTAEATCEVGGTALCHYDLRSDNICLTSNGVKFVDWNAACLASPTLDLGFMLPSMEYEGGPSPERILPGEAGVASRVAGFFAMRAGLEQIPDAPFVRRVQKEQLSTALPWVIRELGLEPIEPWRP